MGSDSFQNLGKWKNPETLIENYPIIIYKRPGFDVNNKLNANITIMDAPLLEISSTHIRELIKAGKSIKYLVPSNIEEEILSSTFFRKAHKK
jgi:nicotinate-nucleotide adenylyltransferase